MTFAARTMGGAVASGALISDHTAFNWSLSGIGGTATATYRLALTGVASSSEGFAAVVAIPGEWLLSGTVALYEAQGIWGAGSGVTGGPVGWNSLSATRDWTLSATNNAVTRPLTLSIRLASTGAVITTATISFDVDSAP